MPTRPVIFAGDRYGRLVVQGEHPERYDPRGTRQYICRCDCGNTTVATAGNLRSKHRPTRSCGCVRRHGMRYTPTYGTWRAMIDRCTRPTSTNWKHYGGRGITVCDGWRDFGGFLADMGERPEGLTLDRIDSDGDYTAENCRWATPQEQARNQRRHADKVWDA